VTKVKAKVKAKTKTKVKAKKVKITKRPKAKVERVEITKPEVAKYTIESIVEAISVVLSRINYKKRTGGYYTWEWGPLGDEDFDDLEEFEILSNSFNYLMEHTLQSTFGTFKPFIFNLVKDGYAELTFDTNKLGDIKKIEYHHLKFPEFIEYKNRRVFVEFFGWDDLFIYYPKEKLVAKYMPK